MKNTSKGFAWLLPLLILAILGAAGVGTYVALEKPSTNSEPDNSEQTNVNTNTEQDNQNDNEVTTTPEQNNNVSNNTSTTTEARIEFPWSSYGAIVTAKANSTNSKVIGQTVNIGGFSKVTTVIGKSVNLGGSDKIGNVYAFNSLNFAASGSIEKLYVEAATSVVIGRNATVGQKFVLSHNELVRQAEAAAGATVQGSTSTSTSTNTGSTTTSGSTSTGTSATTTTTTTTPDVASFAGQWNGTYASNSLGGAACEASGPTSFAISSSGGVTGYAIIRGVKSPGTGKVDSTGKLTGSWTYNGISVSYTGKLNSTLNSGSGTYQDSLGCFGTFVTSR